ncbi:predicted protein [Culex quinquefasciatus]|uniref:Predicted protein n=1 Tax=Culex quinquefasciatus TaxID=7176 RepID=B0X0K9_CULQU|nr:predicted protein [Culex quinquefasciatus]|eukprot:XP_001863181.1 predicted protein [Culex quinquefasciatus]
MATFPQELILRPCKICQLDSRPDNMMLCLSCKGWFHTRCLSPGEKLFIGRWSCAACAAAAELPASESTTIAPNTVQTATSATATEAPAGSILTEKAKADLLWIAEHREFVLREVERQQLELDQKKEEMERLSREAAQMLSMNLQAVQSTSGQQSSANSSEGWVQRIMKEIKNISIGTSGPTGHDSQTSGNMHSSTPTSTKAANIGTLPTNVGTFTVLNRPTIPSTGYSYGTNSFLSLPEHQQQASQQQPPSQPPYGLSQTWPHPNQAWPQPQTSGPQPGAPQTHQDAPNTHQSGPQQAWPQPQPGRSQQLAPQPQPAWLQSQPGRTRPNITFFTQDKDFLLCLRKL